MIKETILFDSCLLINIDYIKRIDLINCIFPGHVNLDYTKVIQEEISGNRTSQLSDMSDILGTPLRITDENQRTKALSIKKELAKRERSRNRKSIKENDNWGESESIAIGLSLIKDGHTVHFASEDFIALEYAEENAFLIFPTWRFFIKCYAQQKMSTEDVREDWLYLSSKGRGLSKPPEEFREKFNL